MHNQTRRALLGAGLAMPFLGRIAAAQSDWPSRPVRIIVPFPPGQAACDPTPDLGIPGSGGMGRDIVG